MPKLPVRGAGIAPPALADVLTSAAGYAAEEKSAATRRAYRSDWAHFTRWCDGMSATALPALPQTVAGYLAHLADSGLRASTIGRKLAAIAYAHKLKGHDSPTASEAVHDVIRGIRRRIGVAPAQKAPATARAIAAMLEHVPDTLIGRRDRAILLIGFAAALRRSELAALQASDIETTPTASSSGSAGPRPTRRVPARRSRSPAAAASNRSRRSKPGSQRPRLPSTKS
jgi:site-specific recombinase XerD